jgi:hypothetical protein
MDENHNKEVNKICWTGKLAQVTNEHGFHWPTFKYLHLVNHYVEISLANHNY